MSVVMAALTALARCINLIQCLVIRLTAIVACPAAILLAQVRRWIAARVGNRHHRTIKARSDDPTLNLILLVLL